MPVIRPGVLYVGSVAYDMNKIVAWWPDADVPLHTKIRFQSSGAGDTVVSLLTTDFEAAINGGGSASTATLLDARTTTGAGTATALAGEKRTYQATITGTGAVTATVVIEVSNNGTDWLTQSTITLSGTAYDTDGVALEAPWPFVRGNITALTGTGAAVTLTVHTAD